MDTRIDEALQRFRGAIACDRLKRMMKLMAMDRNATLQGGLQLIENGTRAREGRGLPFDADPPVPRSDVNLQSSLKVMKETRIVAVEGLGRPGIFEFQGY